MRAFDTIAAFAGTAFDVADTRGTTNVEGAYVSPEFFSVAGEPLLLGRGLTTGDDHAAVAVISHRMWVEQFNRDPNILARTVVLDGDAYTIVGVVRADFELPSDETDAWVPLGHGQDLGVAWLKNPRGGGVNFLGRVRRGVTLAQARDDVRSVSQAVAPEFAHISEARRVSLVRLSDWLTDQVRPTLVILAAAVGLVLLITCANLVNLQLARQLSRSRDIAVHVALGASRARIIGQAFAESALIVMLGSAAALAIGWFGVRALLWMKPADIARIDGIRLDLPVFLFTVATAVLVTIVMALAPVVRASMSDPAAWLQRTGRAQTSGPGARRFRSAVVIFEVAISVVLLVGAVLLGRSFVRLIQTDLGVWPAHVLTAFLDLDVGQVAAPAQAGARENERVDEIVQRLTHNPQVESAGAGTSLPPSITRLRFTFKWPDGGTGPEVDELLDAVPVTPTLFQTLGIPLLAGRSFSDMDDGATPVVILSRAAARELFGAEDPLGRVLPIKALSHSGRADGATVVGVVGDVRYGGVQAAAAPALYVPFAQYPFRVVHLFARTRGEPAAAAAAMWDAVNAVDRHIAVVSVEPLEDSVSEAIAQPRLRTFVFVALSAIAVLLAALGLAGLVAYSVSQRTREIGIRVVLGARPADVVKMVVREGAILAVAGVTGGLVLAYIAMRALASVLYGVAAHDPWSFAAAALGLFGVALLASYLPARRATRIDPVLALRAE